MMAQSSDIVIVGGGVIGLSIAYALVREGIRPTVLDRRELGREASWAGAGLIPPIGERAGAIPTPAVALRSWSARLYPDWSTALREQTGIDTGYRRCGGVDVAWTDLDDQALLAAAGLWRAEGIAYERAGARRLSTCRAGPQSRPPNRLLSPRPGSGAQSLVAPSLDGRRFPVGGPAQALAQRRGVSKSTAIAW